MKKEYLYKLFCSKCGCKLNVTYGLGVAVKKIVKATCEKCMVVSSIKNVLSANYTLYNFEDVIIKPVIEAR